MDQKPSIGRVVWYQAHGSPNGQHKSKPRPAMVTEVADDGTSCHLVVFNPTGQFFNLCKFDPAGSPGTWRWPERT